MTDMAPFPPDPHGSPPRSGTPPLGVSEVIDRSFRLWWRTLVQVFPWALALSIPSHVLSVLDSRQQGGIGYWYRNEFIPAFQSAPAGTFPEIPPLPDGAAGRLAVALALTLVTYVLIGGGLTAYYTDRILLRNTPIAACMRSSFRRIPALLGVALLSGLVNTVGLFACCVGLLFTAPRMMAAPQACVVERCSPVQAVRRSWNLSARRFWPLLGLFLLAALFAGLMGQPLTAIAELLVDKPGAASFALQTVLSSIGSALGYSLAAAFAVFIYLDLRVRFEHLDLGVVSMQS